MTEPVLAGLQQWLLFFGVVAVVGCVAWRLLVVPRAAASGGGPDARIAEDVRAAARVGTALAVLLVVVWALRMVVQVMGFRDPFVPLREDLSFLAFETFWGTVWMAQGVVVVLLVPTLAAAWRSAPHPSSDGRGLAVGPWWALAAVLVVALVATLALSSHAMSVDAARWFFVAADGLHTLAAGVWIGSLTVILVVSRGGARSRGEPTWFAAQLRAFSPMAVVGVTTLLAMGVALAWTHVGGAANLVGTRYGRVLLVKVAVAALVLAAGFWNWRKGLPVVDTPEGASAVGRRAVWEVGLALMVLLVTAVLVHSPKP